MRVKILGFEWHLSKCIKLKDFCAYLKSNSGNEINRRVVALTRKEGFWAGVFLTIKDMKAYCEIKQYKGAFVIAPKELETGTNIIDFNFFLIHPDTGRGLYQHYHQSPVPNTFCLFCRHQ